MKLNKYGLFYLFNLFPIVGFFYFSLSAIVTRDSYFFFDAKEKVKLTTEVEPIRKLECLNNQRIRKKCIADFSHHRVSTSSSYKSMAQIILNSEGKIIGYKYYKIFYPTYFTTSQLSNLLKKASFLPLKKTNLHIVKLTFYCV